MNVAQVFYELRVISNVEIVGAILAEVVFPLKPKDGLSGPPVQKAKEGLAQRFDLYRDPSARKGRGPLDDKVLRVRWSWVDIARRLKPALFLILYRSAGSTAPPKSFRDLAASLGTRIERMTANA